MEEQQPGNWSACGSRWLGFSLVGRYANGLAYYALFKPQMMTMMMMMMMMMKITLLFTINVFMI